MLWNVMYIPYKGKVYKDNVTHILQMVQKQELKPKSMRLKQSHIDWFERNSTNRSAWIRKRIDEAMEEEKE